jgi:hypothetical protein
MRRAGFSIALLASLCGSAIPLPHADGIDDFACSALPVAHDESAHYVGADPTPAPDHTDHCFLCHAPLLPLGLRHVRAARQRTRTQSAFTCRRSTAQDGLSGRSSPGAPPL